MSTQGYVTLHRSIQSCWVWEEKPFGMGQAWVDLIMLANHADKKEYSDGKLKEYKRGTVHRSIQWLANRWGWNRKKVKKFLDALKQDNMIELSCTTHGTTITLVKYDDYNNRGTTDGTTDGQPMGQPRDNAFPQTIMNKNDKRMKKNNKGFTPPTLEEVKEYIRERKSPVDAETFFEYFSKGNWIDSKGNKVRNWKQKLITWEKYQTPEKKTKQQVQNDFIEGDLANDLDEIERLAAERIMRA